MSKIQDKGNGPYRFRVDHADPNDKSGLHPTVYEVDARGRKFSKFSARQFAAMKSKKHDAAYLIATDKSGKDCGQVSYYDGRVGGREGDTGGA